MSTTVKCPWCGMETIDAAVCTWCRRVVNPTRRLDATPPQTLSPAPAQSPLVVVTVCSFAALIAIVIALLVVLEKKEPAVVQNGESTSSASLNAGGSQSMPLGLAGAQPTPLGGAPNAGQTAPAGGTPPSASASGIGGRPGGFASGKPAPGVATPEAEEGFVRIASPAVSFRFDGFHRASPGAHFKTEFHCSVQVRNDGGARVDYLSLPPLDLVFDDGTSYRASPSVPRNTGSGEGKKGGGSASLDPFSLAEIEFVAGSNTAPASLRLIAVEVQVRGGASVDLPLPR